VEAEKAAELTGEEEAASTAPTGEEEKAAHKATTAELDKKNEIIKDDLILAGGFNREEYLLYTDRGRGDVQKATRRGFNREEYILYKAAVDKEAAELDKEEEAAYNKAAAVSRELEFAEIQKEKHIQKEKSAAQRSFTKKELLTHVKSRRESDASLEAVRAVPFPLILDKEFSSILGKEVFKENRVKDVASAARIDAKHLKVEALPAGSVIVDIPLAKEAGDPHNIVLAQVDVRNKLAEAQESLFKSDMQEAHVGVECRAKDVLRNVPYPVYLTESLVALRPLFLCLSLSLSPCVCVCVSLSLSLSHSLNVSVRVCLCVCVASILN
jgi:hypothetical protein